VTATEHAVSLARTAGQAACDKLAADVVGIDVSGRLPLTDVFVIATGHSERQVEAVVDEVEERLRRSGVKPLRREGRRDGRWVLLDFGDIVVHVQHAQERVFYALERLWGDCPAVDLRLDDGRPRTDREHPPVGGAGPADEAGVPASGRV
jgi:ribosome-associated protein